MNTSLSGNKAFNKVLRYTVYLLASCFVMYVALFLLAKYSSTYIQYNATPSVETGFYLMKNCNAEITKGDLVTFDRDKPEWVPGDVWLKRKLKRVSGLQGDRVLVNSDKSLLSICNGGGGGCKDYFRHKHLPLDKEVLGLIPEGYVFVTGDHQDSLDSRYFGFIKTLGIKSCATLLF